MKITPCGNIKSINVSDSKSRLEICNGCKKEVVPRLPWISNRKGSQNLIKICPECENRWEDNG